MPKNFQIVDPANNPSGNEGVQTQPIPIPVPQNVVQNPVAPQPMAQQVNDVLATSRDAQVNAVVSYMRAQGVPDDKIAAELGIQLQAAQPQPQGNPFAPQQPAPAANPAAPQLDANGNPVAPPANPAAPQLDANGNPVAPPSIQSAFLRGNNATPNLVTPEGLPELLNKELNINPTTQEGATQLVSSIRKWRADSQKFADVNKKFTEVDNFLEALPQDLKSAISAHADGIEYKGFFTGEGAFVADYNKTFDTLTPDEITSFAKSLDPTFNITKDDINKPENGIVKLSLSKAWEGAKTSFESQRLAVINQTNEKKKNFSLSVETSMNALEEKYKGMFNEAEKKDISSLLNPKALLSALYDKNGYPKADAAEKISYLLYGDQLLNDVKLLSQNTGRNQGIIEAINANGQQQVRQRPETQNVQELVDQQLSTLKSYIGKKTY